MCVDGKLERGKSKEARIWEVVRGGTETYLS